MSYRKGENLSCCPVCGKQYYAGDFRLRWDGLFVCRYDYEERHPQDFVRGKADNMQPAVVAGCCGAEGPESAPLCPFPLDPLDNAIIGNTTSVNLSFSTFAGIASYQIYFWEFGDSQPATPTYTTTNSPYFVTGLEDNTGYFWFVTAVNEAGEIRDCSGNTRFFTTALPLLACPELVSPANNFLLEGDSITLEWQAVAGATSYNVYLFVENQPRQLLTSTESTSYEASGLALGVDYFWTVTAVNASGESVSCGLRGFSTENTVVLSASSYVAYENEGFATVVLLRSGTVGEVTADHATSDGTATAPDNYTQTTGTATWPNGDEESIPVQIPVEPIEPEFEYSNYVLYPWAEGSNDPRACENDHEYRYAGGSWGTLEDAIAAAELDLGDTIGEIHGWSRGDGTFGSTEVSPHVPGITPDEREILYLHFNNYIPTGGYFGELPQPAGNPVTGYASLYFKGKALYNEVGATGADIWWNAITTPGNDHSDSIQANGTDGSNIRRIGVSRIGPFVVGVANWVDRAREVFEDNLQDIPNSGDTLYSSATSLDTLIAVRRKIRAPSEPCVPKCDDPFPDYPPDRSYCLIGSTAVKRGGWTLTAGTYKALALYATGGGLVTQYPIGPVLPSSDPNYSDEAYWTAKYEAAVLAGTMAAGKTYSISGAGGFSTYPRVFSASFVRGPIKPIRQFTVSLTNPTGAQLGSPDEATITILPSS